MMLRTVAATALTLLAFSSAFFGAAVAQNAPAPAPAPAPAAPAPAMTAASPTVLSAPCASCHGVDGKGAPRSNMPAINGRPAMELSAILKSYKTDQVPGTIMNRLAKGYTDAEIDQIAAHFAAIR